MPVAAVVLAVAAEVTGATAAVGAAVTSIVGAGVVADVVTGAVIGAGSGAITAAATGQDIVKGAEMGAVSGGIGAGVKDVLTGALGGTTTSAGEQGPNIPPTVDGSTAIAKAVIAGGSKAAGTTAGLIATGSTPEAALKAGVAAGGGAAAGSIATDTVKSVTSGDLLGNAAVKAVGPTASTFTSDVLSGKDLGTSAKEALLAGGSYGAGSILGDLTGSSLIGDISKAGASYLGSQAISGGATPTYNYASGTFGPGVSTPSGGSSVSANAPSGAPSGVPSGTSSGGTSLTGPTATLAGATLTGVSPSLAQSLSISPTIGYTPSGSVFGSSDAEGKKSNVWNVGSLRNVGASEA